MCDLYVCLGNKDEEFAMWEFIYYGHTSVMLFCRACHYHFIGKANENGVVKRESNDSHWKFVQLMQEVESDMIPWEPEG